MPVAASPVAEWTISDTDDGWDLRVQLRAPLAFLLRRYLLRNRFMMISTPLVFAALFSVIAGWDTRSIGVALLTFPFALVGAIGITVVAWPFRFARHASANMRLLPDGTILDNYYSLRYFEANRTVVVRVEDGRLDVAGNLFSPSHLATLRLDEGINDGFPDMVDLAFQGSVVQHQNLFGWPGVPMKTALEIRDGLLAQIGLVSESVRGDANKRIEQAPRGDAALRAVD